MERINLASLIQPVTDIAIKAGAAIVEIYSKQFLVAHKSDYSPVTDADLASHSIIVRALEMLTPELPVLSEEDACAPYRERRTWETYWLVDPLDGTREFIKRNDEFTVNIALIHEHNPVLGVVYVPVGGMTYYAFQRGGAFSKAREGESIQINTRCWNGGHIAIAGSHSHRTTKFNSFLQRFDSYDIVSLGSSLKSCLIAEGKADIYARFGPTSEWDTAAAQCIVEEAGGRIVNATDLNPLTYNLKDSLINPTFLVVGDASHDWLKYVPE